jgi:hypothetical protein
MLTARRAGSDPARRQREEAAMVEVDTVRGTLAEHL